ncbi:MAG: lamin tail domain-containing protein [Planctomycetota bacterium]
MAFILAGSANAGLCPPADLNADCRVNLDDLDIFVDQWLDPGECEGEESCANFDGLNGVDFLDFSFLIDFWRAFGPSLVINEFMASNSSDSGISDPQGDFDDWIEIYNYGDTPIDLNGMYLTDNFGNPTKWQIPSGYSSQTTVPADGFVVFWADEETADGPLHADFKLSAGGEEIGLFDANGLLIDGIAFGDQTANISYGRYPDATDNLRFFSTPTPAADNNGAYSGEIEKVEFSHERGFYSTSFNLTLACVTPGANIYYTTDGRDPIVGEAPAPTSTLYTSQIPVSSTKYIRAAAIKAGWMPTQIAANTYIYGASSAIKAMPAVSLVGDPNQTLYEPNGIMAIVGGYYDGGVWTSGGDPSAYNNPIHRGIAYERPVSFEIINSSADGNYQENCGIRVHGSDYTRPRFTRGDDWVTCWIGNNKISFNLFFRSSYGDNRFEYSFFPFTPEVDRYQSIALRGGHNDLCAPFVKDEWTRRLFKEMGGVQVTGTFVNLYINGAYKYYYNPIAREDEEFFQEWYGSDYDFDVITNSGLRDGDTTAWNNLINYANNNDLSNANNYNYFADKFDIVTFIDYLILEIHSGNFDWPGNNWTAHREGSDTGIFRFSIWDADGIAESWIFGNNCESCYLTAFEDFPNWTSPTGLNNLSWDPTSQIYRALKANPNFRQLFADRIHKHFRNGGVLTLTHLINKWWEVQNEVSSVLPYQITYVPNIFLPKREPYVLAAFETNGLFNRAFGAPVFYVNSVYKFGGYVSTSDTFTITDPCSSGGTIYYTTDGSDPRPQAGGQPITFVIEDASKKVLVPTGDIGTTWRGGSEPYNETGWTSGSGGVGYERDTGYEPYIDIDVESAMYSNNGTCYIRIPFNVDAGDVGNITSLTLNMQYDDGFVAYINGTEVKRVNAPTTPVWNSLASSGHEASSVFDSYDISAYAGNLHAGTNILAIHGLNTSTTSSDFLISTELIGTVTPPDISPSAIQYTGGFNLNKSTNLRSRIYKSSTSEWSPINEAVYEVGNVKNSLRITELMYNPKDTGEPNDEDTEYIELKNISGSPINLNLVNFDKGIDFTFGPNTLAAGQYILVAKDINAFQTKYGTGYYIAGEYSGSLNNGGERVRLLDAAGTTILDFNYKDGWRSIVDGDGYSLTIINPANPDPNSWAHNDGWRASAYIEGSPGWDDSGFIPNPGAIAINEVMSHSHASNPDWIELYNTTASPINIGGWFLSDNDSNLMKYRFATGTTIPANGYIVVREDVNFGDAASDPGRLIPFALSENGEMVCLASALDANSFLTGYREKEDFGASETGVTFGRYYKASTDSYNFVPMATVTQGSANAYPKVGPVVITEIMYHPDWPATGNYANDEYEYVELRNTSGSPVTLYDSAEGVPWKFTDGISYTFASPPSAVTIPAGGRILVVRNTSAFNLRYPGLSGITYGPYSGWLANDGEQLELGKPGDVDEFSVRQYIRVDRVNYSDGSHPSNDPTDPWPMDADGLGKSLKRINESLYGNDPNNWTAATPSPGS